jgi:hypothetical protein
VIERPRRTLPLVGVALLVLAGGAISFVVVMRGRGDTTTARPSENVAPSPPPPPVREVVPPVEPPVVPVTPVVDKQPPTPPSPPRTPRPKRLPVTDKGSPIEQSLD